MDHYTELLQSALEAMRGYRQEHGDYQPCDTEKAIEAVLAEQSVTPKSVKTEQSAEVFTMLCCGIECPKCGTSFTVKASQPAPTQQPVLVRDLAEILGATVPEVCDALAECGGPRLSTNMAVSGEEALAVAAKLKQAAEPVAWPEHEFIQWGAKKYGPLLRAAIELLADVDNNLEVKDSPQKFGVPFGKLVALRAAIEASPPAPTQQPLTDAVIDSLYQHMAADERTKPFTAQNWFQAGVAMAEAALDITGSKT